MSFSGTSDKCNACDETVYFVDVLTADGIMYHKSRFKCTHCKGTLVMSNYSSTEVSTRFSRNAEISARISKRAKTERQRELPMTPRKLSSLLSGLWTNVMMVYPLEKVTMYEECFHKQCFRWAHTGCPLTHSSYVSLDETLYCKVHFAQLFMVKGTYSHALEVVKQKTAAQDVVEDTKKEAAEEEEAEAKEEENSEEAKEEENQRES